MYKKAKFHKSTIQRNESIEGETIEQKISRMLNNGESTEEQSVEIQYTERKDGVLPVYNIRHDKWITVQEAMSKVGDIYEAKRQKNIKDREDAKNPPTEESTEIGD